LHSEDIDELFCGCIVAEGLETAVEVNGFAEGKFLDEVGVRGGEAYVAIDDVFI